MQKQTEAALTLMELCCTTTEKGMQTDPTVQTSCGTQTHEVSHVVAAQKTDIEESMKKQPQFGVMVIEGKDKNTKFYTGLPT